MLREDIRIYRFAHFNPIHGSQDNFCPFSGKNRKWQLIEKIHYLICRDERNFPCITIKGRKTNEGTSGDASLKFTT